MKAKLYIGILSVVLLPGFLTQAQIADSRYNGNNDAGLVVNNYYNYDYFYSSRINRFHRLYSTFNFYSPVFTDAYWYNYQPYGWGISIYNDGGFGSYYNYPSYYDYGWSNPYFGNSYSWGYDPFYYSWYLPVVLNIRIGSRWPHNYYSSYGRDRWDNSYQSNHNDYNNYYNNHSSRNDPSFANSYRRSGLENTPANSGNTRTNPVTNQGNRSQGMNVTRPVTSRTQSINTNTNNPAGRLQTTVSPTRRSSGSIGNSSRSVRSGSTSSRSSSTAVRSGSSSSRSSGTTRSSSGSKSGDSSSSSKTRRK